MKTKIEIDKKVFDKIKLVGSEKISSECLNDIALNIGQASIDDMLNDIYTLELVGWIYSRTIEERKLTYYCERPTFLDWLFRRKKKVEFDFKASDLLINPPDKNTLRIYDIKSV